MGQTQKHTYMKGEQKIAILRNKMKGISCSWEVTKEDKGRGRGLGVSIGRHVGAAHCRATCTGTMPAQVTGKKEESCLKV